MFENNPPSYLLSGAMAPDVIDQVIEIGNKYVEEDATTTGVATHIEEAAASYAARGLPVPDFTDIDKVGAELQDMVVEDDDVDFFMWKQNMYKSLLDMRSYRRCKKKSIPLRYEPWLTSMINHQCHEANLEWGFDLFWPRQAEVLEYGHEGDKYDWHTDTHLVSNSWEDPHGHPNIRRKITCIWQLSDGDEYEGGDLELTDNFDGRNLVEASKEAMRVKGSVIAFPSFMLHRITPIKSGVRKSMVTWMNGPAWR
jgi:hypothetical protein